MFKSRGMKKSPIYQETMNILESQIKENDIVLDLAGAKCPFNRANYIVDILPFNKKSQNKCWGPEKQYFSKDTWIVQDMHEKLPFEDKFFDYSICTHTLEDIKDPIRVCKELMRVSKKGYIECPSREVESILHLKRKNLVGYGNHRWFVEINDDTVNFTHKTPYIYTDNKLILDNNHIIQMTSVGLFWNDSFNVKEEIIIETNEIINNQKNFIDKIKKGNYKYNCYSVKYKV